MSVPCDHSGAGLMWQMQFNSQGTPTSPGLDDLSNASKKTAIPDQPSSFSRVGREVPGFGKLANNPLKSEFGLSNQ